MLDKVTPSIYTLLEENNIQQSTFYVAHSHNADELYFLVSGQTKYFVNEGVFELQPGDFMFVPKSCLHHTHYPDKKSKRILLYIEDDCLDSDYKTYLNNISRLRHVRIKPDKLHEFYDLFKKMAYEDRNGSEDCKRLKKLYLSQLLLLVSRYKVDKTEKETTASHKAVLDAIEYIQSNVGENLNLNNISKKYSFSPYYFSKQFKTVTGMGLTEYINMARIFEATRLIANSKLSLMEISQACGFNDSNYFAKVFKSVTGTSPKKYSKIYANHN